MINQELLSALKAIFADMDRNNGEAPGHCHAIKGHWDDDGSQCKVCLHWEQARSAIASADNAAAELSDEELYELWDKNWPNSCVVFARVVIAADRKLRGDA